MIALQKKQNKNPTLLMTTPNKENIKTWLINNLKVDLDTDL